VKFSDVKPDRPPPRLPESGRHPNPIRRQADQKPLRLHHDALRRSKVGDVVEVKVLRDGQTVTVPVKLEQRQVGARPGSCISVIYKLQ